MKKIIEIARELGITPQAVYKKINKQLSKELETHVHKGEKNELLIDEEGQAIIKNSVKSNVIKPTRSRLVTNYEAQIETLLKRNNELQQELNQERKYSHEQIEQTLNMMKQLTEQMGELTRNNQVLLKLEQERSMGKTGEQVRIRERRTNNVTPTKVQVREQKGLFGKLFGH